MMGMLKIWLALACAQGFVSFAQAQDAASGTEDVRALQAALRFIGHRIDTVDGTYGEQTRRAVEAFEFSMGLGNEGELSEGERVLLDAQVTAMSFEKFGYRLAGVWTVGPCDEADQEPEPQGLQLADLALFNGEDALPLIEFELAAPLLVTLGNGTQISLAAQALQPLGGVEELLLFPLPTGLLAVRGNQARALNPCQSADLRQETQLRLPFNL